MGYRMFIDDERDPPNGETDWVVCRNAQSVFYWIATKGFPSFISFDHDLGRCDMTGYDIVKDLVEEDLTRGGRFIPADFSFYVHSQNPVGAENISKLLENYLKHRTQNTSNDKE